MVSSDSEKSALGGNPPQPAGRLGIPGGPVPILGCRVKRGAVPPSRQQKKRKRRSRPPLAGRRQRQLLERPSPV